MRKVHRVLPLVAAFALAGCGLTSTSTSASINGTPVPALDGTTITGHVDVQADTDVPSGASAEVGTPCKAKDLGRDVYSGTAINVKNGAGTIIGTAILGEGAVIPVSERPLPHADCGFPFKMTGVGEPKSTVFQFQIGSIDPWTISHDQLAGYLWDIDLGNAPK